MALLKEDGSLDIERINKLPLEEYMEEIGNFTDEQHDEYVSKIPSNEFNEPQMIIYGSLKEEIASGKIFNAEEVIDNI